MLVIYLSRALTKKSGHACRIKDAVKKKKLHKNNSIKVFLTVKKKYKVFF
jgi:hypothetical protein